MAPDIPPGTPAPSERSCERQGDIVDFGGRQVATGPCLDSSGRPIEHSAYVFPTRRNSILRWSIVAAAILTVALVLLYFAGTPVRPDAATLTLRTSLSPGPTIAPHTLAKLDCAQCHRQGQNVEDVRCERCHDPIVTARLSNAAHVLQGAGDLRQALAAPTIACVTCHVEHRGERAALTEVDDRECGACHKAERTTGRAITTLARHPEFAIVRAGSEVGSGLRWFNHEAHLRKVWDKFQTQCETCHQRAPGAAAFGPITFSKHCAGCHEEDLRPSAGTLPQSTIDALGTLPRGFSVRPDADDPTRQAVVGITHADSWVLRTVQSLRSIADPAGVAADRLVLDRQVAQLELMMAFPLDAGNAGAWINGADAVAALPDPAATASSEDALRKASGNLATFAKELAPLDPASADAVAGAASQNAGTRGSNDPGGEQRPSTASVEQLRRLIDATIARAAAANNQAAVERAQLLKQRLERLPTTANGVRAPDDSGSRSSDLLRELRAMADPGVRSDVAELESLARLAQQRNSIDPTAFDLHRQRTLRLLSAVQAAAKADGARSDARFDGVLARATALQEQLLAAFYGMPPDVTRARLRFFSDRQIARARVDAELDAAGLRLVQAASLRPGDPSSAAQRLGRLRQRLTAMATAQPPPGALSPADARDAIAALIGREAADAEANILKKNRCTLCHELSPNRDQLAPIRMPGSSLLVNATFSHQKHVTADTDRNNCVSCHTGILESAAARDLNLPGIASCRTCHTSGQPAANASGCETCHKYHAPAPSALMWRP